MKNTSLILSIISLIAVVVFGILTISKDGKKADTVVAGENTEAAAAQKGDIVYLDLDRILMEYDMANDLRSVVETKVQNIQAEVNRRGQKLEGSSFLSGEDPEGSHDTFSSRGTGSEAPGAGDRVQQLCSTEAAGDQRGAGGDDEPARRCYPDIHRQVQ